MTDPLYDIIRSKAANNGQYAIAYALLCIETQLKYLGTGDAATTQGALELVAQEIKGAAEELGSGLSAIADATDRLVDTLTPVTVEFYKDIKP